MSTAMKTRYTQILKRRHTSVDDMMSSLIELRWLVLSATPCPAELRGWIWKILLGLGHHDVSASCYIGLVQRGPSAMDAKIRNDTSRTMTTDMTFSEHVSEAMLIRVLNAFVWISGQDGRLEDTSEDLQLRSTLQQQQQQYDGPSATTTTDELGYVQGMNVLVAPFLIAMPEMEAFFAFSRFLWQWCPLYVQSSLKGVHCGIKLVDTCLRMLDPELFGFLVGKGLTASMYAFPSVLTFSACTPPLPELLKLWDVMFAFGFHLNILYIVAQLALVRAEIMANPSPMRILRKLPALQADAIIPLAIASIKKLPPRVNDLLVRHLYDDTVADELGVHVTHQHNYTHLSLERDGPQQQEQQHRNLPEFMKEARNLAFLSAKKRMERE